MFGNNAFLGVVNLMTKRVDKLAGAEGRGSRDSVGLQQARASWSYLSEAGWEGWLAVSESRQNHMPLPYDNPPETAEAQRERLWQRGKRVFGSFNAGAWALRAGSSEASIGYPSPVRDSQPALFE